MPIIVSDNIDQNIESRSFAEKIGHLWAHLEAPIFISLLGLRTRIQSWRVQFCLLRELIQRARQQQLNKIEIRKLIIAYINNIRKVIEYMMYSKYIFSIAYFRHSSVCHVGIFRGGSYRSNPFGLSE